MIDILVIVLSISAVALMLRTKIKSTKSGGCCGNCKGCKSACKGNQK